MSSRAQSRGYFIWDFKNLGLDSLCELPSTKTCFDFGNARPDN